MDKAKRNLQGSPTRDIFKKAHKDHAPGYCYASDLDLMLVRARPNADIVAFLDYKKYGEDVTFAEVIAYNSLIKNEDKPIYIIRGEDPQLGPFDIYQYLDGNWRPNPPICKLGFIAHCNNWAELVSWELLLRSNNGNHNN